MAEAPLRGEEMTERRGQETEAEAEERAGEAHPGEERQEHCPVAKPHLPQRPVAPTLPRCRQCPLCAGAQQCLSSGQGLLKLSPLPSPHPLPRGLTYTPPISLPPKPDTSLPCPQSKQTPVPTPCLKETCPVPLPQPSQTQGRALLEPACPPPSPLPPCGPWCMLQSMQFLCLFCLFFFSVGGLGWGGGNREGGVGAPPAVTEKAVG